MSTTVQVALVPRGVQLDMSEVSNVAAALSIQISRDFGPIWGINATVSPFPDPMDVPLGYWPIFILDPNALPPDEGGVHLTNNKQPYALIKADDNWSLDASHECLEMLVDPSGNKTQANPLLDQAIDLGEMPQQVQYVVEVCDPSEDAQYAYQINGVLVSDFFTPNFYDAAQAPGVKYDFTGHITAPRQVLTNGYISWFDPMTGSAKQLLNFQGPDGTSQAQIRDLGQDARFLEVLRTEGLRPAIDRVTQVDYHRNLTEEHRSAITARHAAVRSAAKAHAQRLHDEIEAVLNRR